MRDLIDKLVGTVGNFRSIAGISEEAGSIDISSAAWGERLEVIRGIHFDRVKMVDSSIIVNFVDCSFTESDFHAISADGHFSGAKNNWENCGFSSCRFDNLIAPYSNFDHCRFSNVKFRGFTLFETKFSNCSFESVIFDALSSRWPGRDNAGAAFEACSFLRTKFSNCRFAHVVFDNCHVEDVKCISCDFSQIAGTPNWWAAFVQGDPFVGFLDAALEAVAKRVGNNSSAFAALSEYRKRYLDGSATKMDYANCLYTGQVPYDELNAVSPYLEDVELRFGI